MESGHEPVQGVLPGKIKCYVKFSRQFLDIPKVVAFLQKGNEFFKCVHIGVMVMLIVDDDGSEADEQ